MKQRTRLATVLMFCFAMVLSLIGAVFTAFAADVPVGKQIGAPDTAFDSNGWFTQTGAAEVMAANGNDPANILNADPGVYAAGTAGYLGHHAPEALGGYTGVAIHANSKVLNKNELPVGEEISFEFIFQVKPNENHRMIHFMDAENVDGYLGLKEENTMFGIWLASTGVEAQLYIKNQKQALANGEEVLKLEKNPKSIWVGAADCTAHYIQVKIGTEKTSVYIDNQLMAEVTSITQSDFPSGKVRLALDFWGGGDIPWGFISPFGAFNVYAGHSDPIALPDGEKGDIVFGLTGEVASVKTTNAEGKEIVLEEGVDYTAEGGLVTVKNAFFTGEAKGYFANETEFIFTEAGENGRTASSKVTILYNNPPAYEQKEVPVYANDSTQDLTFTVDYEAEETYTLTLNGADVAAENYTATWADNKITVTLKAAYLTTLAQGAHTFTLKTLAGTVDYSVYRKTVTNEWVSLGTGKTSDGSDVSVIKNNDGSTTVNMGFLTNVYYSEKLNPGDTVYFEMDINKFDKGAGIGGQGWIAIGLVNSAAAVAGMNESNGTDRLTFLYVVDNANGNNGEFQCIGYPTVHKYDAVNQYGPQLFAISLAKDTSGDTTISVNGINLFTIAKDKSQELFPDGCYFGIFSGSGLVNFNTRTVLGDPVANSYGLEYTLGADQDVTLPLYNADSVTAVKYGEDTLSTNDYSYANGMLTVKSSFLKTISYAEMINLVVTADGCDLKINIKAITEVSQEKAVYAYAGTNGAAFDKTYAGKTVQKVIDTATTMELVKDTDYEVAADGTLTVRKSYMTEEKVYSFAVLTEDGLSYVIAVNYAFNADGIADRAGAGTGSMSDGVLSVEGASDYLYKDMVDLSEEVGYTLNFTKTNGYYLAGQEGSQDAYVAISFYDIYTGNTITVKIYANDAEDSGAQLGCVVLSIRDKNGNAIFNGASTIADERNFIDESVIAENPMFFLVENGTLTLEFGQGNIFYLDIGDTVTTHLLMSVSSTADVDGNKIAYTYREGAVRPDPVTPPVDGDDTEDGCDCGGSIAAYSAAGVLMLAAAAVLIGKKRTNNVK